MKRLCVYGGLTVIIILASILLGNLFESNQENDCEQGTGYSLFGFEHNSFPIKFSFDSGISQRIENQTLQALDIWDNLISINLFERNNTDYTLYFEHRKISPEDHLLYDLDNPIGVADINLNQSLNGDFNFFYNATIIFNSDYQFENLEFSCNIWDSVLSNKTVDILSVALHEIGHVLGLDHFVMYSLTMNPNYQGSFQKTLAQGDINGFLKLFGGYEI